MIATTLAFEKISINQKSILWKISYHEQAISAEESCKLGCRSKDLPWTNGPSKNLDNELTSAHVDIWWEQHRRVSAKGNHVGCNIDSDNLDHPGECAKENGESDTWCPIVIQDQIHHIPLVPVIPSDTCYMMRRAFSPSCVYLPNASTEFEVDSCGGQNTKTGREGNRNWVRDL